MTEPTFTTSTERLYARLPEAYRTADARQGWAMKRWLSGIGDVLNEVDTTIARLEYVPADGRAAYLAALDEYTTFTRPAGLEDPAFGWAPIHETSDLLDARTADDSWLDWMAQLVGVRLADQRTATERRTATYYAFTSLAAGSKQALHDAVWELLTGDRFVRIYDHSNSSEIGTASEWEVLVVVRPDEAPPVAVLEAAIERKKAKPAGVTVEFVGYQINWTIFETEYPTWTAVEADTWEQIELSGSALL